MSNSELINSIKAVKNESNNYLLQIFSHIIKHDQLNYIIQNTETYTDLHKLFVDSGVFPMDSYNEFEFMLMLAFLGNNGKPHNLYDEIILNTEW